MLKEIAFEHLKDGKDCLADSNSTIKRVQKSFPVVNDQIEDAIRYIDFARDCLQRAEAALKDTPSQPRSRNQTELSLNFGLNLC